MKYKQILIALILVAIVFALRLLPHPPNLAPVSAVAIVAGIYLSGRSRFTIPLIGLVLSDIVLGFYKLPIMAAVYGSFMLSFAIGVYLKKHPGLINNLTGGLLASISFFIITNFSVWLFGSWYPKTIEGLALAYTLAIPFFRNTLTGDLIYLAVLITAAETIKQLNYYRLTVKQSSKI